MFFFCFEMIVIVIQGRNKQMKITHPDGSPAALPFLKHIFGLFY